jgi:ligand-binding sensor domain-containing protein
LASRRRGIGLAAAAAALLLGSSPARALDPEKRLTQYHQQVWTTVEGLPQATVQAIAQTPDGYLWVGTRAGLARFNGQTFTVFDPENTPGLQGRTIQALHAGRDGRLWIGTDGLGVSELAGGVFTTLGQEADLQGRSGNVIREDPAGAVWIGTWDGVVRLAGGEARRFDRDDGLPHNAIFGLSIDAAGTVWAATSQGLSEIRDGQVRSTRTDVKEPQCLLLDRGGRLWIGTAGGLDRLEEGRLVHLDVKDGLLASFVTALAEDRHGSIWIGTQGGLNRFHDGRIDGLSSRDGLPGNVVASLLEDREGNLWVGLRGSGLVRLRDGALTTLTSREGLSDDGVTCAFQSRDGSLWFGTGSGLTRYRNGEMRVFRSRDGLLNETITGIGEHSKLGLLVATFARKLNVIRGDRVSVFEPLEIESTVPSVIHEDRDGGLWVGTLGAGLYRVVGEEVEHFPFADSGGRHVFYGVHEDEDGTLWFATPNGLVRYASGRFEPTLVYELGANLGVAHSICAGQGGDLWIATRDRGVCRFRDGATVRCYGRAEGLFDDAVYQVLADGDALWMSGPRGIARVPWSGFTDLDRGAVDRLPSRSFGVADGMMSAECQGMRWPAGFRDSTGRLWFPTSKGVALADPARLPPDGPPPPVVFEAVRAGRTGFAVDRPISVPPGRGDLEITYAGLSFSAPERVSFRYRLDGFDADWFDAGTRRRAVYTNLRPGRYSFRVAATIDGRRWSEPLTPLQVTLEPHFYETPLWYVFLALCVAGSLFAVHRRRVGRLRARADELARRVQEELAKVKVLGGLLPICASCKRIRRDEGYWEQIEAYIHAHSEADFSHGICPECARKLYPEYVDEAFGRLGDRPPRTP